MPKQFIDQNTLKGLMDPVERSDHYRAYERRDEGDWVMVLFHQTAVIRLFPSLEQVGGFYSWSVYRANVFINAGQLAARLTTKQLVTVCTKLELPVDLKAPSLILAKELWAWGQANGDRVERAGTARSDAREELYTVNVQLLKDPDMEGLIKTLPHQARVIAKALADAEKTSYTVEELSSLGNRLVASTQLKTKQDPFRVIRYYMPTLYDLGLVAYPSRRGQGDDETEDAETAAA